jgi:hypothetical protein
MRAGELEAVAFGGFFDQFLGHDEGHHEDKREDADKDNGHKIAPS